VQAIVVATAAVVHAEEVILAIDHNLHIICEKPLSTTIESVRFQGHIFPEGLELTGTSRSAETSSNPRGKVLAEGHVRLFVAYSAMSSSIFVDMAIHDVDLSLWFFGEEQTVPKTVSARGD
jgi:myo-inositol 2-dehydrogenase / D-chiro-inositol 1-dehydrogenase